MGLIGLIPARGGSKSIPHKNLSLCGGRPLLAWTADAAREAGILERVLLSTDDEAIAEAGAALGLEVPFLRPTELAEDESPMLPVLLHALSHLRGEGTHVDALVLLQPTSPLRTGKQVAEAVRRYLEQNAETLVSVVKVPHQFVPSSLMKPQGDYLIPYLGASLGPLRRQEKEVLFARNGPAILIVSAHTLDDGRLYGERTIGYEMDERSSVDVDAPIDLALADFLLRRSNC